MRLNSVWNWIINSNAGIDERTFLSYEFGSFLTSKKRMLMITSKEYYRGNQDIAHKQRTMVDQNNIEHLLHRYHGFRLLIDVASFLAISVDGFRKVYQRGFFFAHHGPYRWCGDNSFVWFTQRYRRHSIGV